MRPKEALPGGRAKWAGNPGHSGLVTECVAGGKGQKQKPAAHARKPTTSAVTDSQGPRVPRA